jgi:alpha-1,2-mannosyltransferase
MPRQNAIVDSRGTPAHRGAMHEIIRAASRLPGTATPPSRTRVIAWASVFLAIELAMILLIALLQRGYLGSTPTAGGSDFPSFYAAGKLVLAGSSALAYDVAAHQAMEVTLVQPGAPYAFFFYPPPFLALCAVLALLPYRLAFALLQVASGAAFIVVLRAIARPGGWSWLVLVAAFPATLWTVAMGQNAFLNAALLGGFTLLLQHRPIRAGALLGALCIKPHLAILAPAALFAGRRWRTAAAASGVAAILLLGSAALLGMDTWRAFFTEMAGADRVYASGVINFVDFISVFAGARVAGLSIEAAATIQAVITIAAMALAAVLFLRRVPIAARNATLLACTPLAAPVLAISDQIILLVAGAWLWRDARRAPLGPVEVATLAAAYPLSMLAPLLSTVQPFPYYVALQLVFAAICARRALVANTHRRED